MLKDQCIVPGCIRQIGVKKHMLCRAHLSRLYRTGKVGEGKIAKKKDHPAFINERKDK